MKKIIFVRGHKILCLLSISGGFVLISFIGHADFSFASDLVGDAPNLSISLSDNSIIMTPTVPVSGTATDNLQILSMTWNVDNGNVLAIPGIVPSNSVAWSFDISHLSNGLHVLQINATNSAGFVTSKTISFTLYNDSPVPTASLPNGTYDKYQTVKLETSDPALIFYTLDGTTPTLSSSHGQDSITLPEIKSNTILKFFAVDAYGVKSNVSTQVYIIANVMSSTPMVSNASNVIPSTQIATTSILENKPISPTTALTTTVLPKSSNVVSSASILTSQNMNKAHTNFTMPVTVQSNSTVSTSSAITQNMTTANTNSTMPVTVQSNSTVSTSSAITQNMTTIHTNSTMSVINQTNSTLNVHVNGTK